MRVGVIGAGSWGTALAVHTASLGLSVRLWGRDPEAVAVMADRRINERYLPAARLGEGIEPTSTLSELGDCEVVLVVVPSHVARQVVAELFASTGEGVLQTLVSASKGIEVEGYARMSEVIAQEAARAGLSVEVASLSGPTFADELAAGVPSAAVVAAERREVAERLCADFSSGRFRLYSSTDLVGVELGGTTKNVIAIGSGMIEGLGLGQNTRAALITRGLREIARLGEACGGRPDTFAGLAGLGDLVLTCTGGASRNLQAGVRLARGTTIAELQSEAQMVAEGLINTRSVAGLARSRQIEMPITEQMEAVIYHGKPPTRALEELMTRDLKAEAE